MLRLSANDTRAARVRLVADAEHYELLIREAIAGARVAVWVGTANVKAMMVEAPVGTAARARRAAVSVLHAFEALAKKGVELRLLHASLPSRAFRDELSRLPALRAGGLVMRRCPRVHFKLIVVDGTHLYVGSANFTGAGLGAKGRGRRNFELGIVTDDDVLLDATQARFERVWSGAECAGCRLRAHCPAPLDRPAPTRPGAERGRTRTKQPLLAGGGHARALEGLAHALHDGIAVLPARDGRVAIGGCR
jgi:phosphatidylserine/phosphatidylglycerophosphate/cardiolipin synthase-like enzyme